MEPTCWTSWAGKAKEPARTLFWEFSTEGVEMYAAMRGDFKRLRIGNNSFLYNLRKDPGERRTLRGEEAALFTQMERELETWIKAR